jgi:hypothetical protein
MEVLVPPYAIRFIMAVKTLSLRARLFILQRLTFKLVKHDFDWNGICRTLRV